MTYVTGDVPVGAYEANRLSNIGIGHGAIDAGGGYTYFDPQTGHEFSAVLGVTYNFENPSTDYQNGIDLHLDWGASQFLSAQWQVGLVGYAYKQITPDGGSGDRVGALSRRCSDRAADRPRLSGGPVAGLSEPQGLQGIWSPEPARRLECLAHLCPLSCPERPWQKAKWSDD